jgi:hypothetical protein
MGRVAVANRQREGRNADVLELRAEFPSHLRTTGSRYYRTVTFAAVDAAQQVYVGIHNADEAAHWLLMRGPLRLRAMWLAQMYEPSRATGRIEAIGRKRRTVTSLVVGFDSGEPYPFRLLTPFGSGFGQLGRVWLSREGLERLLDDGATLEAPEV